MFRDCLFFLFFFNVYILVYFFRVLLIRYPHLIHIVILMKCELRMACLMFSAFLQAPFTNKGAKWYLNLAKRCRHGKSRTSAWSKMEENAKTLINLGESSQAIIARLLGLTCMQLDRESSEATASDKDSDTASTVSDTASDDKDSDSDDATSDKASNKETDKSSDKDSDKASDKDSDSDDAPSSPDSPRDSPEESAEQSHNSQDLKTPVFAYPCHV